VSFSIYFGAFEAGDARKIPVAMLREKFGGHFGKKDSFGFVPLSFGGGTAGEIHIDDGDFTDGFSVLMPPEDLEFWEIVAGILRDYPCLLYWGVGAVMGSLELLPHLPAEFVKRLGIPFVSTDPERIRRYVGENS
jgi:hypothetical protein